MQQRDSTLALRDAGVLALAALWLTSATGWFRLTLPGEGRNVGVAWDIASTGQWLGLMEPAFDGRISLQSPSLSHCITSGPIHFLGSCELAARVASLLGAIAIITAMYRFAVEHLGRGEATWAVLVMVTTPFFYVGTQFANLGMLSSGCITVALLGFAEAALQTMKGEPTPRSALLTGYAGIGLGLLAKGIVGLLLPTLVIAVWLTSLRCTGVLLRLLWWPGAVLTTVFAAPWFAASQRGHTGLFDYFFGRHPPRYILDNAFNNAQPWWFYLPVLAALTIPWSLVGPFVAARNRRAGVLNPLTSGRMHLIRLLWIWAATVLVFFSLPNSKLVGDVIPILPPLALWIALVLLETRWCFRRAMACTAACLCLAAVWVFHVADRPITPRKFAGTSQEGRSSGDIVAMVRPIRALGFHWRSSVPTHAFWRIGVCACCHRETGETSLVMRQPLTLPSHLKPRQSVSPA